MSVQKAEIIRVIHTISSKGKGTADDMGRLVDQYWSFNGKLLAERDPCKELFGGKGDKEIEQFISGD